MIDQAATDLASKGGHAAPGQGQESGWNMPQSTPTLGWSTTPSKPVESLGWNTAPSKPDESLGWNDQPPSRPANNGWSTVPSKPDESLGWNDQPPSQPANSGWNTAPSQPVESLGWDVQPPSRPANNGWSSSADGADSTNTGELSQTQKPTDTWASTGWGAQKDNSHAAITDTNRGAASRWLDENVGGTVASTTAPPSSIDIAVEVDDHSSPQAGTFKLLHTNVFTIDLCPTEVVALYMGNWRWKVGSAKVAFIPQATGAAVPSENMCVAFVVKLIL
jgi:hypothetical protein